MESQTLPSLRPLRLGELLDQAIRLYRRNFLTFVGIIAVVYVPVTILQTASSALLSGSMLNGRFSTPEDIFSNSAYWIGMLLTFVLIFVQVFLVQGVATGALARAVGDNYLGKKTGILDAYRGIGRSWITLLTALLFLMLLALVVILWTLVPCIGWFTGFGMLVFLTGAASPLVAPVVILENPEPQSLPTDNIFTRFTNLVVRAVFSIRRAWSLARRRFWPLLGYILVLYLFSLIIVNGPAGIVSFLLTSAVGSFNDPTTYLMITTIVQALVTLVVTLIYYPLQMTAFTLIYFDLRVRTEGFDIALSSMQLDPASEGQFMPSPPPATGERLITGTDFGNFAILTLGAAGIYILIFSFIMGGVFFASSLF